MDISIQALMQRYWDTAQIAVNLLIFCNLFGALVLGFLIGYERWYNGRAAGMRTYGLVSMASAGVVSIVGYADYWYGGISGNMLHGDMTRITQGILTGVGFLGAGLIMKEGLSISGLTSAAAIWVSSVIGILVGIGFYGAAILLSILCAACMMIVSKVEKHLPGRSCLYVTMQFDHIHSWTVERLQHELDQVGFILHTDTIAIKVRKDFSEWSYMVSAKDRKKARTVYNLSQQILQSEHVIQFSINPARN